SALLSVGRVDHHWYLDREFEQSLAPAAPRLDAEIRAGLERLRARGVPEGASLVEAYVSEHRGARYIAAQLLSCRAALDVAVPFAGGEVFTLSTAIPLEAKVHNTLNRRMLARHAPELLRQ